MILPAPIEYVTLLTERKGIVTIKKSLTDRKHCIAAGAWLISLERGEANANYITYREIYRYDNRKKQQPPLCQVTVVK